MSNRQVMVGFEEARIEDRIPITNNEAKGRTSDRRSSTFYTLCSPAGLVIEPLQGGFAAVVAVTPHPFGGSLASDEGLAALRPNALVMSDAFV